MTRGNPLPTYATVVHHVHEAARFASWSRDRIRDEVWGRIERLRAHGLFEGPAEHVQVEMFGGEA
jgi:hypothetical protein